MRIRAKRTSFRNRFLWSLVAASFIYIMGAATGSAAWIVFSPLLLVPACVLLTQNMQQSAHDAYDLVFDASGVTMYDGKQMTQHNEWSKYKTRCIVSHLGEPEWIYFSQEPLYVGAVIATQRGYHFGTADRAQGPGFQSSHGEIGFRYRPEIYAAFRKSCPDVELLRIDTTGEVYVITDDDREILVARIFDPYKVNYPREEDSRNMLEILNAINAVREAEAAKPKVSREAPDLAPEEMPVFTVYPKKTKNPEEAAVDRWDRENAERKAAEELYKEEQKWYKEFLNKNWREKRVFEIIENPVAQKSVMAATAPETAEPEPAAVLQTEAAAEITQTEAAVAEEEIFAEETVFPEESAEEELEDVRIPGVRSVEEILASASRTVESVRGLGSRFREEDASAEVDDTWEEESFFDEDTE